MTCPKCGKNSSTDAQDKPGATVTDVHHPKSPARERETTRRRVCLKCGYRFSTVETIDPASLIPDEVTLADF